MVGTRRMQVAQEAIVTILNGAQFVDEDAGSHDLDCWYDQAAGLEECSCSGTPAGVAYAKPLAALLDATADTSAVAA